tara:strand:+ start:562 stop:729 length:168 start_codon:yes stop_codon:yes gene_type:complete
MKPHIIPAIDRRNNLYLKNLEIILLANTAAIIHKIGSLNEPIIKVIIKLSLIIHL